MVIGEDQAIIAEMANMMGGLMEPIQSNDFGQLLIKLLPLVIGPMVTAAFKRIVTKLPAAWIPVVSAIVGALTSAGSLMTGAMTGGVSVVQDIAVGAGLGLGGAKARDLKVGKPHAAPPDFGNA